MLPDHCRQETVAAHVAAFVEEIHRAKERGGWQKPLQLYPFRTGANLVARIDMPFWLTKQEFADCRASYFPVPHRAKIFALFFRYKETSNYARGFARDTQEGMRRLMHYCDHPTKNGLASLKEELSQQKPQRFWQEVVKILAEESLAIGEEGLSWVDGKVCSLDIAWNYPGFSAVSHLRKWHKGPSLAFKVARENAREELAWVLASLFQLETFLLPKVAAHLKGVSLEGLVDPQGLASGWIAHKGIQTLREQLLCSRKKKPWKGCDRFSYEGNLLLDLLLGSYDSHAAQYVLHGDKMLNVDFSRFGLPADAYVDGATYAAFCSVLLDATLLSQSLSPAMQQLVASWDLQAVESALQPYLHPAKLCVTVAQESNRLDHLSNRIQVTRDSLFLRSQYARLIGPPPADGATVLRGLRQYFVHKNKKIALASFSRLHPKAAQRILERSQLLQKYRTRPIREIFAALYPGLAPIVDLVKDLYPAVGIRLAFSHGDAGRLVRTPIEELLCDAAVQLQRIDEHDAFDELLRAVRKEAVPRSALAVAF